MSDRRPWWSEQGIQQAGLAASVGGALGFMLAPVMVIIKYMTGWSVIPEPAWISAVQPNFGPLLSFASPVELWMVFGTLYTVALVLMFAGLAALFTQVRNQCSRTGMWGCAVLLAGFCLVIPGDAIHTATWHQNGLTTPTPGTNIVANTAYGIHMMGMNLVMIGSMMVGVNGLRNRFLAAWLGWVFVLIFPSAVLASVSLLPTTPSGALWLFSLMMMVVGYSIATRKTWHLSLPGRGFTTGAPAGAYGLAPVPAPARHAVGGYLYSMCSPRLNVPGIG